MILHTVPFMVMTANLQPTDQQIPLSCSLALGSHSIEKEVWGFHAGQAGVASCRLPGSHRPAWNKRHAVPPQYCKQLKSACKAVAHCRAGPVRSAVSASAATF